jgi:predicted PurR-regulated permease PerM
MKDLRKQVKNKVNKAKPLYLMIIGFILGLAVMYLFIQPKLTYQGKSVVAWATTANKATNENAQLKQDAQTIKDKLEQLQNAPTPTPAIKYITQPSNPTTCYTYNRGKSTEFMQCQ